MTSGPRRKILKEKKTTKQNSTNHKGNLFTLNSCTLKFIDKLIYLKIKNLSIRKIWKRGRGATNWEKIFLTLKLAK